MTSAQAYVGRVYPGPCTYQVGREKIRSFADAVNDPNPVYRDPEAAQALGYSDVIAPPTFGMVVTADASEVLLADPDLGIEFSRVVHGEQRFEYSRPIVADDVLTIAVTFEDVKVVAGNEMFTYRADATDASGSHVLTARSMLVVRGDAA